MKTPEKPDNEAQRLETLDSLEVLDTPAEERFNRLTRLAKRMFDVPIALVSLVDADRQWFKSCVGLEVRETPREISFCGHAILGDELFVVSDATGDTRFFDNPLVTDEPNIRFYAGCPLKHLNGSKLGTLCIIDDKPRSFDQFDLEALQDQAGMAERELAALQLATLDELTQISNRRGFIALAQKSLNLCKRQGIPAALVFIDLDRFKPINDNFGHTEGDRALQVVADQMAKSFRNSDVFARLGGDEFVVLLTNATESSARESVARFREGIETHNRQANAGYDICFSDGILEVDTRQLPPIEELLNRADTLMYESKNNR